MLAFNRVILTGRVATPPRCSYRPDGSPVIQFPLDLDEIEERTVQTHSHGNKNPAQNGAGSGPRSNRKRTEPSPKNMALGESIHIVAVGRLAEVKLDLQSGQHLLVIGQLHQRSWKTPEGKKRTRTEVIAMDLRTIDDRRNGSIKRGEEHEETG
jgi:single-stranded DNA-binding protein